MKIRILLCHLIAWGWLSASAQNTFIHLDKPYYLAGEYLFYSFCNPDLPDDTLTVRVDLFNNESTIDYYYLKVNNKCGDGYIKLPFDLPSGIYRLMLWVVTQKTYEVQEIAEINIPIYNDQDLAELTAKVKDENNRPEQFESNSTPRKFEIRQEVDLIVKLPEDSSDPIERISVSIRDLTPYRTGVKSVFQSRANLNGQSNMQGIPVFGTRSVDDVKSIKNPLLFAYNPANMLYDGTKVMDDGRFDLTIHSFYGENPVSFLDYVGNDISIKSQERFIHPEIQEELEIDSTILNHLKNYQEEKQINRLFKQVAISPEYDSMVYANPLEKPSSFVDVQDYAIRGTSIDLFREITTNLKFRPAGGGDYRARMIYEYNGITKFYSRSPLFIVNGKATRDGNFVAKLPLQDIAFFRIYSDYEFLEKLSPMAHGGIVYVDMLDPNYELPELQSLPSLNVRGLQRPLIYPVGLKRQSDSPAIGSLLYWHPDAKREDDQVTLHFQTGDIASEYLVEIVLYRGQDGSIETIRQVIKVDSPDN
ncbi:MAG: hypothetical protein KDC80_20340 [Saprospiraceae bacterium]|nr:hypothetical protein [Saprospiraceae bacterium]